jgi:hypothetical protein
MADRTAEFGEFYGRAFEIVEREPTRAPGNRYFRSQADTPTIRISTDQVAALLKEWRSPFMVFTRFGELRKLSESLEAIHRSVSQGSSEPGLDPVTRAVRNGLESYFFEGRYVTRLREEIRFPGLGQDMDEILADGERYVRDLTRILIETGSNVSFHLPVPASRAHLKQEQFAARLAEATTMAIVESLVTGVSILATDNPLLVGAIGTFAATMARKSAEKAMHDYLCGMESREDDA